MRSVHDPPNTIVFFGIALPVSLALLGPNQGDATPVVDNLFPARLVEFLTERTKVRPRHLTSRRNITKRKPAAHLACTLPVPPPSLPDPTNCNPRGLEQSPDWRRILKSTCSAYCHRRQVPRIQLRNTLAARDTLRARLGEGRAHLRKRIPAVDEFR